MDSDDTGKAYADLRREAFQANMYSSKNQNQPISFAITSLQRTSGGTHDPNIHSPQSSKPLNVLSDTI